MLTRLFVCGGMAAARLTELGLSRANIRESGPATEGEVSRKTYPFIVVVHTIAIGGTLLFGRRRPAWPWLAAWLAVQPVRIWVLATLGKRWNTRAAVPVDMTIETGGPYACVRHPNYTVIGVELLALPMAFGLRRLAIAVSLANAVLLALRIRDEEAALSRLPAWREHFATRKRFIPGLF